MSLLRHFVRLLPLLAVFLMVPAQPFGARVAVHGAAIVSHGYDVPNLDDFITRKNRRAVSLEEYFAIDDDPDQYDRPVRRVAVDLADYTILAAAPQLVRRQDPRPSHRPCAAPPTGPPHA